MNNNLNRVTDVTSDIVDNVVAISESSRELVQSSSELYINMYSRLPRAAINAVLRVALSRQKNEPVDNNDLNEIKSNLPAGVNDGEVNDHLASLSQDEVAALLRATANTASNLEWNNLFEVYQEKQEANVSEYHEALEGQRNYSRDLNYAINGTTAQINDFARRNRVVETLIQGDHFVSVLSDQGILVSDNVRGLLRRYLAANRDLNNFEIDERTNYRENELGSSLNRVNTLNIPTIEEMIQDEYADNATDQISLLEVRRESLRIALANDMSNDFVAEIRLIDAKINSLRGHEEQVNINTSVRTTSRVGRSQRYGDLEDYVSTFVPPFRIDNSTRAELILNKGIVRDDLSRFPAFEDMDRIDSILGLDQ